MPKICTIAIAVWNQRDVTRRCLESLILNTDYPFKALLIDNGSGEDTKKFLGDFCKDKPNFSIKRFDENIGYLNAANFAFSALDTPYICLLNNDTIVTGGWLSECIAILEAGDRIGIVSPTTNEIGRKFTEIFNANRLGEYKGQFIEADSCLGSCFIVKQEVADRIGGFDPIYTKGYFEEVDYCFRARREGFISLMALGAYITHLSGVSFRENPQALNELWHKNRGILEARWGKPRRIMFFIRGNYAAGALSNIRKYIVERCRARTIVDFYCKHRHEWIEKAHFNIRGKRCWFYNFFVLYLILRFKKKSYDAAITDVRMPLFLRRSLKVEFLKVPQ